MLTSDSTRKPWAIDRSYFTPGMTPLYLTNMAVAPALQGKGIGRAALEEAVEPPLVYFEMLLR